MPSTLHPRCCDRAERRLWNSAAGRAIPVAVYLILVDRLHAYMNPEAAPGPRTAIVTAALILLCAASVAICRWQGPSGRWVSASRVKSPATPSLRTAASAAGLRRIGQCAGTPVDPLRWQPPGRCLRASAQGCSSVDTVTGVRPREARSSRMPGNAVTVPGWPKCMLTIDPAAAPATARRIAAGPGSVQSRESTS